MQYFLHLLIIDMENMKYFKNNEIQFYRPKSKNSEKEDKDD